MNHSIFNINITNRRFTEGYEKNTIVYIDKDRNKIISYNKICLQFLGVVFTDYLNCLDFGDLFILLNTGFLSCIFFVSVFGHVCKHVNKNTCASKAHVIKLPQ